ncbi:transposase [soil metagenome]
MKILDQALNKINGINKKQRDFFATLVQGLIGVAGKRTFRNLARYMKITEHTFLRQMAKAFDFAGLNTEIIKATRNKNDILIAAQDASFIQKSGKATHGLDYYWNGCASKAEKGLEIDVIAVVKVNEKKEGYALSAKQTPANPTPKAERKKKQMSEPSRIDFYLSHVKEVAPKILELGIKYIAADAFLAKNKYVNGVVVVGLHVISKLRVDARLRRIYHGPQKPRGRKRKFDNGKVNFEDFKDSSVTEIHDEKIELRSCIAYSISLNCLIKVVLVRKNIDKGKYIEALLFSTDLELDPIKMYQFYVSRFQIEFVFRDAKGFTGLTDCQSRDAQRLHYHFNASLTALNVAKIQDNEMQKKEQTQHAFSMTNWARKYHVEIVINRFISMFGFDQTLIKSHPDYDNILAFGNVRH